MAFSATMSKTIDIYNLEYGCQEIKKIKLIKIAFSKA